MGRRKEQPEYGTRLRLAIFCTKMVNGPKNRLGFQHHASAPPVGHIIGHLMPIQGKFPKIPNPRLEVTLLLGTFQHALVQHRTDEVRKQGDNVTPHGPFLPPLGSRSS